MSEQQGLAEVMGCSSGDPECGCDSAHDARHILASPWLRAHDDRIRAAALAPVLALADEWEALLAASREVRPYKAGDTVGRSCGKVGRAVLTTVNPLNWNAPEHLAAYCETRACSCSLDVRTLPKQYVVTRWELEAGAYRLLRRLAALRVAAGTGDGPLDRCTYTP